MGKKLIEYEESSILKQLWEDLDNRPFYIKWLSALQLLQWECMCHVRWFFFKKPINVKAKNDIAHQIKDDIEFGYDLEMIYTKIMAGSYGNEPIDRKEDWFEQNGIDWKVYLRKDRKIISSSIDNLYSQEEKDIERFISANKNKKRED